MSRIAAEAYLQEKGFLDRLIVLADNTATVALAAQALGVEPGCIAKSIALLLNEQPILILAEGTARIDNPKFKKAFGTKARMIPPDRVEEMVGHAPGGVSPFGRKPSVSVYLDESLRRYDTVYPAAGDDHTAVRLTPRELEAIVGAAGWVDVTKG